MGPNIKVPQVCDQALQYLQKCISLIGSDTLKYLEQITGIYLQSCEFERLDSILNDMDYLLSYTAIQLKHEGAPLMAQVVPFFFTAITQVAIPSANTSEVEKQLLAVFSSFNRLIQNCAESVGVKNMELQGPIFDAKMANWLALAYNTHPEKGFKKMVVIIFKAVQQQVTNIKHLRAEHVSTTSIAQLLGMSNSTLAKAQSESGVSIDLASLPQHHQAFIEAGLTVSAQNVFKLNPKVLDDVQIVKSVYYFGFLCLHKFTDLSVYKIQQAYSQCMSKSLIDIQIALCMLGLGQHVKRMLSENFPGPQKEEAAQALIQIVEQFCQGVVAKQGAPAPQLREVHEQYIGLLKQIKGQK